MLLVATVVMAVAVDSNKSFVPPLLHHLQALHLLHQVAAVHVQNKMVFLTVLLIHLSQLAKEITIAAVYLVSLIFVKTPTLAAPTVTPVTKPIYAHRDKVLHVLIVDLLHNVILITILKLEREGYFFNT